MLFRSTAVTIAGGILAAIDDAGDGADDPTGRPDPGWASGLLLAVAFAASVGGLATPIGTPPNLIGLSFIRDRLGVEISFPAWCLIGVPVAALLTVATVLILGWMFPARVARLHGVADLVARERAGLGKWTTGQASTAIAFAVTVGLWVVPGILGLCFGPRHQLPKWFSDRLPEGVAALVGAVLLFVLPGGPGRRALRWQEAAGIDWGIILLYGGGMALGELSFSTGLADALGKSLTGWIPAGWLVIAAAIVAVVTSEFTSNTASANVVVPVALALAAPTGADALPAALAATFGASLGFMMPVSTPCNAIVYGTGRIRQRDMIRAGFLLDIVGTVTVAAAMLALSGTMQGWR